jgi:hypothetical protein
MAQRGDRVWYVALGPAPHRAGRNLRVGQALGVYAVFLGVGPVSVEAFGAQEAIGRDTETGWVM